jgi:hypothetical protein
MNKWRILCAATSGALLATLAVSASEALTPNEIINSFEETFDVHPEAPAKLALEPAT